MVNIYLCHDGESPSDKLPAYSLSPELFFSKIDRSIGEKCSPSPVKYGNLGIAQPGLVGFRAPDHVIAEIASNEVEGTDLKWEPGFHRLNISLSQIEELFGAPKA